MLEQKVFGWLLQKTNNYFWRRNALKYLDCRVTRIFNVSGGTSSSRAPSPSERHAQSACPICQDLWVDSVFLDEVSLLFSPFFVETVGTYVSRRTSVGAYSHLRDSGSRKRTSARSWRTISFIFFLSLIWALHEIVLKCDTVEEATWLWSVSSCIISFQTAHSLPLRYCDCGSHSGHNCKCTVKPFQLLGFNLTWKLITRWFFLFVCLFYWNCFG